MHGNSPGLVFSLACFRFENVEKKVTQKMPRPQTPNHPPHPPKENLAWLTPSSYVPVYDKVTSLLLSNGGAQLLQTACIAGNVTPCRNDNMRMVISKRNNIHQDLLYCTCNLRCNQTHSNTIRLVFIRSKLSTWHLPHIQLYTCTAVSTKVVQKKEIHCTGMSRNAR